MPLFDKPRIALLHYSAPPIVGGVEAVLAQQARLFSEAGYPTIVVAGRGGQAGLPSSVAVTVIPEIDAEHPATLALTQALERGETPVDLDARCAELETALAEAWRDCGVVIAHNVMTLHLNLPLAVAMARLAQRAAGPHIVAWCHDLSRYVIPARGQLRHGYPWDVLRTYQPAVTYVAVSPRRQRLLAEVLGCPPELIHVIANGVDPAELLGLSANGQDLVDTFGLLDADLVLLMPVRITRAKNIEFALHVAARLKQGGIAARLVVTGPPDPHAPDIGRYCDELRDLSHALKLDAALVLVADGTPRRLAPLTITAAEVGELYRVCDVVLLPSLREGFGMPVLEAGLAGKPIFATEVPAVELVGVDLVQPIGADESPGQVAERILAWMADDREHRLRRRVRQAYTWRAIFDRAIEPLIAGLAQADRGQP